MTFRASSTFLAVLLVTLAACGRGDSSAPGGASPRVIEADGSSTVFPVTEAFAEEFRKATGSRVTVGSSGTTGGFQKFCRDETDVSNASRPISPSEIEACGKAGIDYIEIPVAYDGLAVMVNSKNTWVNHLTVAELKKIW